ncbi:laccase-3-like [Salvia hispanica]|uniref:laccase-3-like n=1 Tax=Salvia hispanica TaxID=49212 RepID=UPI00200929BF|nr:laccase-3-like [Salvia hispanica]
MRILPFLAIFLLCGVISSHAKTHHQTYVVSDTPYSRLCSNKSILTVNGKFPGPTIRVTEGDTIAIVVVNRAKENITIHWHGVKQPRYPWSDGPEYITQCPIRPGTNFSQKIVLSDEIGTMWWHAHSDWSRATVHGALIVYPRIKDDYPFPVPDEEVPIIIGEWWKSDIFAVLNEFLADGGGPNASDAYMLNGQPGDLYPCSNQGLCFFIFSGIYVLVSNILNFILWNYSESAYGGQFSKIVSKIRLHFFNVFFMAYLKPFTTDYIAISPGQTIDLFNYTAAAVPQDLWEPQNGTRVRMLDFNATVELVFQGTSTARSPLDHPMHLHGHSFYVVGWGYGNFNSTRDPPNYNLIDPPLQNTIAVPRAGWTAIRFVANNPGVWLMHCHFERHITWGMEMTFITRNGKGPNDTMLPPPSDFPMC